MTNGISAGSILVEDGATLPPSLEPERDPAGHGWSALQQELRPFEKALEDEGWTFFYMAGEIAATVFGFDRPQAVRTAVERLTANAKTLRCNSIEITEVAAKSFLRVPYVRVSAHLRHLQRGTTFSG